MVTGNEAFKELDLEENRLLEEQNDRARVAFEKERDRRATYLAMDERINRLAGRQIQATFLACVAVGFIIAVDHEYGKPSSLIAIVAIATICWWQVRNTRKQPSYKIGEVDELAEDTIIHERIVTLERDGKPWAWVKSGYVESDGFFDYPYWEDVKRRVSQYSRMSHRERLDDNKTARRASIAYRKAMLARLTAQESQLELPYWARLSSDESGD